MAGAALVAALAVPVASPVSAQASQVEPRVLEALKACSIWVNDNDIAAAKAVADAAGFVVIGPGGSRSLATMSGSLSALTVPNGTTVVTQSTLGY